MSTKAPAKARAAHPGVFIALEGGEGTGKSTQLNELGRALKRAGHDPLLTREPGATQIGAKIRALLLDPSTDLDPLAEAMLFAADRAQHVARLIWPALEQGRVVVTDRFVDSSIAYQAAGRALDPTVVAEMSAHATRGLVPDLTVVLDLDPRAGLSRATALEFGAADRMEVAGVEFHDAVRAKFLDLASAAPDRYLFLNAAATPDAVHDGIWAAVEPLLTLLA